jgi:DNA-binding response OmpR family regulator
MQNLASDIDLMVKPFHIDELVTKVRDMLSEPSSAIGNNVSGLMGRLEDFDLADIIIAEGMETVEQLDVFKTMKGEYAQGFYLFRPTDSGAAEELLSAGRYSVEGKL